MSPYVPLVGAVVGLALLVGGYAAGRGDGRKLERAEQDRAAVAVREAEDALQRGLAEGLSKITVTNTTIRQRAETVTREVPVYRDCRHDPRGLQSINAALTGVVEAGPVDGGVVPGVDATR